MGLRQYLAAVLPRLNDEGLGRFCAFYQRYAPHLDTIERDLYSRLNTADQKRFLQWFLKRWARIDLLNEVERGLYLQNIERLKAEERETVELDGKAYLVRDFQSQGYDFKLLGYDWVLGVHDVEYNQYEHGEVRLAPGDVIIDAGAFIGDTAVLFNHKLAGDCEVHSFELLDENLALFLHNLERNGVDSGKVVINKLALTDRTGDEIVVASGASEGATSIFGKAGRGDVVQTVTIDDYVLLSGLKKLDFIKMDIEGAEVPALRGAMQTLQHFQPKLAICLYHKWDDPFTIPKLIHESGVDYHLSFKWVQLTDGWEAVLLAHPATEANPVRKSAQVANGLDPLATTLAVLTEAFGRRSAEVDQLRREQRQALQPLPKEAA